ncbi:MAG: wax ester/triacylglycerol synthase family O-acyltransferase [Pseudomonadales bacterium]
MKPLSTEDAFFLYSETEHQHQHTLGLLILDPSTARNPKLVTPRKLADKLKQDIGVLPEFRQKLAKLPITLASPVLVDDPDYNFEDHIQFKTLRSPGNLRQLSAVVGRFASQPLEKGRPLWENLFIDGLEGGMIAVCTKSHHLIGDGVQGAEFMAQQFDSEPHPSKAKRSMKTTWTPRQQSYVDILGASWSKHRQDKPGFRTMFDKTLNTLRSRRTLLQKKKSLQDMVTPLIPTAPKLKFNGSITGNRTIALGTLRMDTLKTIKNHHDVTINDVVLTACTLALRDYLVETNDLPDEPVVCAVPVSLKMKGQDAGGGNAVGSMIVKLPVQIGDPVKCLKAVHDYTGAAKEMFDATFENLMLGFVGLLPPSLANTAMKTLYNNRLSDLLPPPMNLVVSNFPGPRTPLYMEGAELQRTYPIGPITAGSGLNMTFMSQMDHMNFSVQTCREKLPEAWDLADGIMEWIGTLEERSHAAARSSVVRKPARKKARAKIKAPMRKMAPIKQKTIGKRNPTHKNAVHNKD